MAQKKEQSQPLNSTNSTNSTNSLKEQTNLSDEQIISIFSTGEKVEKTPRGSKPIEPNKKKGKGKNKK